MNHYRHGTDAIFGKPADALGGLANETETRALDLMVELHRRGLSLRAICTELEELGIPTKTGQRRAARGQRGRAINGHS